MQTHNKIFSYIVLIVALLILIPVSPFIIDMLKHNYRLYSFEQAVDSLDYDQFGKLVANDSDLGLLVGNSNHTDYWVIRLIVCKGDMNESIRKIKQFYSSTDIGVDVISIKGHESAAIYRMDIISEKYGEYVNRDDVILIHLFRSEDAGYDIRSH